MNWIQRTMQSIQKHVNGENEVEVSAYDAYAVPKIRRFAIRSMYALMLPSNDDIHTAIFTNNTACSFPPPCFENESYAIVVACENRPEPLLDGLINWIEL